MIAQQYTEYNRKGDEAMTRRDYSDARLFYSEGVTYCDLYSVDQLTQIWLLNPSMRTSMYNLMSRCLTCLSVQAEKNDTTAISSIITYYSDGIGTPKNTAYVDMYKKRLDEIRNPVIKTITETPAKLREKITFFAGYSYSTLSPVGLTVGAVGKQFGGYARFKTNASFQSFDEEFVGGEPAGVSGFLYPVKKKANSYMATVGLVVKCSSRLYASAGVGYGNRGLLYLYSQMDDTGTKETGQIWLKSKDASYGGLAAELDLMVKFGRVYLNTGLNTLTFEYIDLNAGVGVFF